MEHKQPRGDIIELSTVTNQTNRFEVTDPNGEVVYITSVVTELVTCADGKTRNKMQQWLIEAEGETVDMMEMVQPESPIYVSSEEAPRFAKPKHGKAGSYAVIPNLDSLDNLYVALHELGHMAQYAEFNVPPNVSDRQVLRDIDFINWSTNYSNEVRDILELEKKFQDEGYAFFRTDITKDRETGLVRLNALSENYFEIVSSLEREGKITNMEDIWSNETLEKIKKEWNELFQEMKEWIDISVFRAYRIFLEKDATRRALKWATDLKERGVKVFSVKEGNTSGPKLLRDALKVYTH